MIFEQIYNVKVKFKNLRLKLDSRLEHNQYIVYLVWLIPFYKTETKLLNLCIKYTYYVFYLLEEA